MAVYEAGYFGFWLYDELTAFGVTTFVNPPSLIPSASGNKVKTDRLDSDRLAPLLQAGLLTCGACAHGRRARSSAGDPSPSPVYSGPDSSEKSHQSGVTPVRVRIKW